MRECYEGHEAAWAEWQAVVAGGRMHHGWLLTGREGLGKGAFARRAAAYLVAEPGVHQPDWLAHPDILVIEPLPATDDDVKKRDEGKPYARKRNISVDQVRAMQRRLVTRPTLGSRRAVIIDPADALEASAANALLKSLEEPPVGTVFLLIAHSAGRLLPTVRSRCQVLRFAPLDAAALDRAVGGELGDAATRRAALALAGGAPGAALALADLGIGKVHPIFEAILESGDPDLSLRGRLAGALGARPARDALVGTVEAARRLLLLHLSEAGVAARLRIADAHDALVRLGGEVPIYNYDPALLLMEIGGLLASIHPTRDPVRSPQARA